MKYDEPSYIKNIKLEILGLIASESNIQEIVSELSEYVTDVNADIAKRSIRCFGTIIVRIDIVAQTVSGQMRNFLQLSINYVTNEIILVLKDVLRKYPHFITDFQPYFGRECLS